MRYTRAAHLFLGAAILFIIGILIGAWIFYFHNLFFPAARTPEGYYEGVSFFIASGFLAPAVTLVISGFNIKREMQQRANQLLRDYQDRSEIRQAFRAVGALFNNKENVAYLKSVGQSRKLFTSSDSDHRALMEKMRTLGNFFEILAISIRYGEASEGPLRAFFGGMYVRSFHGIRVFLPVMREQTSRNHAVSTGIGHAPIKRPDIFNNAEWLYRRWRAKLRVKKDLAD